MQSESCHWHPYLVILIDDWSHLVLDSASQCKMTDYFLSISVFVCCKYTVIATFSTVFLSKERAFIFYISFSGASSSCIFRYPANWSATFGQFSWCFGELGGPAEPVPHCALQHCGPALHHPTSGSRSAPEQHTGPDSQLAGLWYWPREGNPVSAVSGGLWVTDGRAPCQEKVPSFTSTY